MKKTFACLAVIIGLVGTYVYTSNQPTINAPTNNSVEPLKLSTAETKQISNKDTQPTFVPPPFPTSKPSQEICERLAIANWELELETKSELQRQALNLVKSGHSVSEVTIAAWNNPQVDWLWAQDLHRQLSMADALKNNASALVHSISMQLNTFQDNPRKSSDLRRAKVALEAIRNGEFTLDASKAALAAFTWNENYIYHPTLELALKLKNERTNEKKLSLIRSTMATVDPQLLSNPYISPITVLFQELISNGAIEDAVLVSEHYPEPLTQGARFTTPAQVSAINYVLNIAEEKQQVDHTSILVDALSLDTVTFATFQRSSNLEVDADGYMQIGPNTQIADMQSTSPPSSSLALTTTGPKGLSVIEQNMLEQCNAFITWRDAHRKTTSQWDTFRPNEFTEKVIASAEYQYCSNTKNIDRHHFAIQRNSVIGWLKEVKSNEQISQLELTNLPEHDFTNAQRTILGLELTARGKRSGLSESQIRSRITAAGFAPSLDEITIIDLYGDAPISLWLNDLTSINSDDANKLARVAASYGSLHMYKTLEPYTQSIFNEAIDPLFLLLSEWSPVVFFNRKKPAENIELLGHLLSLAPTINASHRRALLKLQLWQPSQYELITQLYPELTFTINYEDYFEVQCG